MSPFALQARFVLPMAGPPIPGGIVVVSGGRIARVGTAAHGAPLVDLGEVALLPGLVNAHTHLEFSLRQAPLGRPGMPLPEWLQQVVVWRGAAPAASSTAAVASGLSESLKAGTTSLGEIATESWSPAPFRAAPAEVTVLRELIGYPRDRVAGQLEAARDHLARVARPGLSPHAPYSVHPDLVRAAAALAAASAKPLPIAMHLAESPEEIAFLRDGGSGPLADLLRERGAWEEGVVARGTRPLDYLRMLSAAPRVLVVHGNYLDDEELQFLAAHSGMTLVYCPRTHSYFGHPPYPLAKALALGVTVALGTDSRASNPDLSLLADLRHAARLHAEVEPARLVRCATLAGARALGQEADVGTLEPGKLANLAAVALGAESGDPYELLLRDEQPVVGTWYHGRRVFTLE